MAFLPFVLVLLGIPLAWLAWVSLQSLLQGRALYGLARLAHAEDERGGFAVRGRVRLGRPLDKGFGDLLWCRTEKQIWRRRGKSSGWASEGKLDEIAMFSIEVSGRELELAGYPTEVQGTHSRIDVHERTGLFGWGHGQGDRRTLYTYLPVVDAVTVVGRRTSPGTIGTDNKLGLLLSPHEPSRAAAMEVWKGVAGLVLVTAAIVAGLVVYYG